METEQLFPERLSNPRLDDEQRTQGIVAMFKDMEARIHRLESLVGHLLRERERLPENVFDVMGQLMNTAASATRSEDKTTDPSGTYSYVEVGESEPENENTMSVYKDESGHAHLGVIEKGRFEPRMLPDVGQRDLQTWLDSQNLESNRPIRVNIYFTPDPEEA